VATFHAALLEGLARRGGEVELLGALVPTPPSRTPPVSTFHRPEGVGIAEFYEGLLGRLHPDVVLMNHVAHTIGVTHARLSGAPPAVGIAHSWHNISFRHGEERARARAVTEEALGGLATLVVPSRHCRQEGERLGLPLPADTETIHYPLPPPYAEAGVDPEGVSERRGVLYVGSLIERKNPAGLVEAAALSPGAEVTIVGEGEQEGELREQIAKLGLDGRVRLESLLGERHLERLRDLYLSSAALCLPSASESFGIVFIEALACGTPVVGFSPTVREIGIELGTEIGVPLEDRSPAAIAAALDAVASRTWDRHRLRQAVCESFALGPTVDRYLRVLSGAVANV
jgi:glycosyltransferase involved in cell wall biosynthesis